MLVLTARGRPMGEAHIIIELEASEDGAATLVTIHETPCAGPGKMAEQPRR